MTIGIDLGISATMPQSRAIFDRLEMLYDNRTMLASFRRDEDGAITTHFMTSVVESFYSRVNLSESRVM